jgi:hypothetical protein
MLVDRDGLDPDTVVLVHPEEIGTTEIGAGT